MSETELLSTISIMLKLIFFALCWIAGMLTAKRKPMNETTNEKEVLADEIAAGYLAMWKNLHVKDTFDGNRLNMLSSAYQKLREQELK